MKTTLSLAIQLLFHAAWLYTFYNHAWYITFASFIVPMICNAIMFFFFILTKNKK